MALNNQLRSLKDLFHIHDMRSIYSIYFTQFMGEKIKKREYTKYSICKKCGGIKEYSYDSQGGSCRYVSKAEFVIIKKQLKAGKLIAEGLSKYYHRGPRKLK